MIEIQKSRLPSESDLEKLTNCRVETYSLGPAKYMGLHTNEKGKYHVFLGEGVYSNTMALASIPQGKIIVVNDELRGKNESEPIIETVQKDVSPLLYQLLKSIFEEKPRQ
ncbi:MAG: hypothetical protein AABX53_01380 [Nanoarchaeota archaeon]